MRKDTLFIKLNTAELLSALGPKTSCEKGANKSEANRIGRNKQNANDRRLDYSNQLLTLLCLYAYIPNQHGNLHLLNTKDIAEYLHLDVRTVEENLKVLSEKDYISCTQNTTFGKTHYYNITINQYNDMFQKGQGQKYITVPSTWLYDIVQTCRDINSLRAAIRLYILSLTDLACPDPAKRRHSLQSKTTIRTLLPSYLRGFKIKEIISKLTQIGTLIPALKDSGLYQLCCPSHHDSYLLKQKVNLEIQETLRNMQAFSLSKKEFLDRLLAVDGDVIAIARRYGISIAKGAVMRMKAAYPEKCYSCNPTEFSKVFRKICEESFREALMTHNMFLINLAANSR